MYVELRISNRLYILREHYQTRVYIIRKLRRVVMLFRVLFSILFIFVTSKAVAQTVVDKYAFNGTVRQIVYDSVRGITYVGGDFNKVGVPVANIAIFDKKTGFAKPFVNVIGTIHTVVPDGFGGYYFGGKFSKVGDSTRENFAHVSHEGNVLPLRVNVLGEVYTIYVSGNLIYIGGIFSSVQGVARMCVAGFSRSGVLQNWHPDIASSPGTLPSVYTINQLNDGSIIIGGTFTHVDSLKFEGLAVFDTAGVVADRGPVLFARDRSGVSVQTITVQGDSVLIGGTFDVIGDSSVYNVCIFSQETNGYRTGTNFSKTVYTSCANDSIWVFGGDEAMYNSGAASEIVILNKGRVFTYTTKVEYYSGIRNLSIIDNNIVACGTPYSAVLNKATSGLAYATLVSMNGDVRSWIPQAFGPDTRGGLLSSYNARFQLAAKGALPHDDGILMWGKFTGVNPVRTGPLIAISSSGEITPIITVNNDANAERISTIRLFGDTLLIAGRFSNVLGTPRNSIALIQNNTVLPFDAQLTGISDSLNGYAFAERTSVDVAERIGNVVYMAGRISSINNQERQYAGAITIDGDVTPWAPKIISSYRPAFYESRFHFSVLTQWNNNIVLAGRILSVGDKDTTLLAVFNPEGGVVPTKIGLKGVDFYEALITSALPLNGNLILGGVFKTVNGVPSENIFRLRPTGVVTSLTLPNAKFSKYGGVTALARVDTSIVVAGDYILFNSNGSTGLCLLDTAFRLLPNRNSATLFGSSAYLFAIEPVWDSSTFSYKLMVGGDMDNMNGINTTGASIISTKINLTAIEEEEKDYPMPVYSSNCTVDVRSQIVRDNLELSGTMNLGKGLEIFSMSGEKVLERKSQTSPVVDVSHLSNGVYVMRLFSNSESCTAVFVKEAP